MALSSFYGVKTRALVKASLSVKTDSELGMINATAIGKLYSLLRSVVLFQEATKI